MKILMIKCQPITALNFVKITLNNAIWFCSKESNLFKPCKILHYTKYTIAHFSASLYNKYYIHTQSKPLYTTDSSLK